MGSRVEGLFLQVCENNRKTIYRSRSGGRGPLPHAPQEAYV